MKKTLSLMLLALAGCTTATQSPHFLLTPGSRYVAMGSSYAAGAGIGALVPDGAKRCGRTVNNYPHLLAAHLHLDLADVSCGGATTANILGPWSELPPQIDAVTPDTQLVTVTIGGNDVGFVRNLFAAICGKDSNLPPTVRCPKAGLPSEADWSALDLHMREIARQVARRAPQARLIFVDYLRVIPENRTCATVPLDSQQAAQAREVFRRLAALTAQVAREEGAMLLPAGTLSRAHDACSVEPWTQGFPAKATPWHPTDIGHAAVADALVRRLSAH